MHVLRDIDGIAQYVEKLTGLASDGGSLCQEDVRQVMATLTPSEQRPFRAALAWFVAGMESVFIQDADSLVLGPAPVLTVLHRLEQLFPSIRRITTYARSATITRMSSTDLADLAEAGLNRIHIGMESGDDTVLARMCKGATKDIHISAGRMVKQAGIELSEYYMPGLGGCVRFQEHAQETADALNCINPDFIRLRTLAIPQCSPLATEVLQGRFRKCPDLLVVKEIGLFLEKLRGVSSYLASDHILNLLPELEGKLPQEHGRLLNILAEYLALDRHSQVIFQIGRRLGILERLADRHDSNRYAEATAAANALGATTDTVDSITDEIVRKFI